MQRFNHFNATVTVPLVARIVLFCAFFFVGANKLFTHAEFDADEAERLRELGATVAPITENRSSQSASVNGGGQAVAARDVTRSVVYAAFDDELFGEPADEPDPEPAPEPAPDPDPEPDVDELEVEEPDVQPEPDEQPEVEPEPEVAPEPEVEPEPARYKATDLHRTTLIIDAAGWPLPIWQARAVAVIEMVGGALLLIGLFSRLWGMLLAGVMVGAFYVVSMSMTGVHTSNPFVYVQNINSFNMVAAQLAIFVLALGILLTGPGPVSMDRLLFRGRRGAGGEPDFNANGNAQSQVYRGPSVYPQREDVGERFQ